MRRLCCKWIAIVISPASKHHMNSRAIGLATQSWLRLRSAAEAKCCTEYTQPITLAADATTLHFVYRSLRTINRFEAFTLFSRVTLIRRLQSMSDLDHFHAREQPCSRAKSRDDPISGRRGDSRVLYSFIYIYRDVNVLTRLIAVAQ